MISFGDFKVANVKSQGTIAIPILVKIMANVSSMTWTAFCANASPDLSGDCAKNPILILKMRTSE